MLAPSIRVAVGKKDSANEQGNKVLKPRFLPVALVAKSGDEAARGLSCKETTHLELRSPEKSWENRMSAYYFYVIKRSTWRDIWMCVKDCFGGKYFVQCLFVKLITR
jgi:hypothetical protein